MSAIDPTQSEIENLKTMAEVFDWAGLATLLECKWMMNYGARVIGKTDWRQRG